MKMVRSSVIILVWIFLLSGCKTQQITQPAPDVKDLYPAVTEELRGVVIKPELWISNDPESMKRYIREIMINLGNTNYNAVFFQVRKQAETFYPSGIDPWSGLINSEHQDFDPTAIALEEAHQNGLKFYAVLDLLQIWNNETPPENPDHLYFQRGPGATDEYKWVCINKNGEPEKIEGAFFLNPVLPEVKTYLKTVVRQLIESYNLDGLHFDFVDYPIPRPSYDSFSITKFKKDSLLIPTSLDQWTVNQLTDLMEDVVVEAMLVKPYLVNSLSCDNSCSYVADWLKMGIVDLIMPQFNLKHEQSLNEFNSNWDKTMEKYEDKARIYPMISLEPNNTVDDLINGIKNILQKNRIEGTVWDWSNTDISEQIPKTYLSGIDFPDSLKKTTPDQIIGLELAQLFNEGIAGQGVHMLHNNKHKSTDSEGNIGFITTELDTLKLAVANQMIILPTQRWSIPFRYAVTSTNTIERPSPWVEFRRMPKRYTNNPSYHLLCKTDYSSKAWIMTKEVKVYKTGIFFDEIQLEEGPNRIKAIIMTEDSSTTFYEREFVYHKSDETRQPFPLWIDERSVEPGTDLELLPDDVVRISFKGSLGQSAVVELDPDDVWINCSRIDFDDYSLYEAELPLRKLNTGIGYKIKLTLKPSEKSSENQPLELMMDGSIMVKELDEFPFVKTSVDNARLTYNLGPVRLGGPIRSELSAGVIMKTNGSIGNTYRIRLNQVETGIIHQRYVEELPSGTVQPSYFITNLSCAPTINADIVSIPYLARIPYAVTPEPDQKRIVITLFGAKTSSTWISHRQGRKIVDKITWQQTTPETYEVYINLKTDNIWGYEVKPEGKRLIVRIKYPPEYDVDDKKPLSGLKIAIEAGHGGFSTGAIGLSGLQEKDINLDLSLKLGEVCKSMGAEILQVRDSDKTMSLIEKRDIARNSDADLLISIHANAAGTSRGYLRVPGTSTYYNNSFWAPLAEDIYDRLLELDLEEFGVVGSFNYTVIRVSEMPSILVEQAFMTHAEDEEKLADPEFRQDMAQKIYDGIVDYLRYMKRE